MPRGISVLVRPGKGIETSAPFGLTARSVVLSHEKSVLNWFLRSLTSPPVQIEVRGLKCHFCASI